MKEHQVEEYMLHYLSDLYTDIEYKKGQYLFAKGSETLLVAHMDTVRDERDPINCVISRGVIENIKGTLGADDRAGVHAICQLVKEDNLPSVLLTQGEESGGIGVKNFVADHKVLEGINMMIEIDRQGCNEYVTYNSLPREVTEYVTDFGFEENSGIYSDIADLTDAYKIPSINVSAGYHHQHSHAEYLVIDELNMTISKVKRMLADPIGKLHIVDTTDIRSFNSAYSHSSCHLEDLLEDYFTIDEYNRCYECGHDYKDCTCNSVANAVLDFEYEGIDYLADEDFYKSAVYEFVLNNLYQEYLTDDG